MKRSLITLFAFCTLLAGPAWADQEMSDSAMQAMMEQTGPPEEMKELEWLVGSWDVMNKERFDPSKDEWQESHATCSFEYTLSGAALAMHYHGSYMGFPFEGFGLRCWDRFHQEWQMAWTDNASGALALYTGKTVDGVTQMVAKGDVMGTPYWSRVSWSNITKDSYDWTYEESTDEGTTWRAVIQAKYTKKK